MKEKAEKIIKVYGCLGSNHELHMVDQNGEPIFWERHFPLNCGWGWLVFIPKDTSATEIEETFNEICCEGR